MDLPVVYQSRWWDYRRVAPGHSLLLFAREYHRAIKSAVRKMMKHNKARYFALTGGTLQERTETNLWEQPNHFITGLFKSMIFADLYGMPYDLMLRIAMQVTEDRKWPYLPLPRQLYSDATAAEIVTRWEDHQDKNLTLAKHPMYLAENYADHPLQNAYRDWLVERIKTRSNRVVAIAVAVCQDRHLSEDYARYCFGDNVVDRAVSIAA